MTAIRDAAVLTTVAPPADRPRRPQLSLVIPAWREADRIGPFLQSVREYLAVEYDEAYEVIVVDDGSDDGLDEVLLHRKRFWPQLITIRHSENRGKGAAVRTGILASSGQTILFADADGATPIAAEQQLREQLAAGADIAVGSRRLPPQYGQRPSRAPVRLLPSVLFSLAVRSLFPIRVRDTQCGFKMFQRDAGLRLARLSRSTGYLLDVEILALADHFAFEVAEVGVEWREIPGSKVHLLKDSYRMWRGLLELRRQLHTRYDELS